MNWDLFKEIIEYGYYISGILLVIGIYLGISQVKLVKKDMRDRSRRAAVEKSIEYLALYATKFIPMYSEYKKKFADEVPIPQDTDQYYDGKFYQDISELDKIVVAELIVKQEAGLIQYFNELEYFSVAVLEGLTVEDLVYTPVGRNFCRFIRREHLLLAVIRHRGAPYKNLLKLYNKWSDRLEVERLELQKLEVENKIKQKGNDYKSTPPIGY